MILGLGKPALDVPRLAGVDAGCQNHAFLRDHAGHDPGNLFGRFAFAVNDFRKALAQTAVMVHVGVAEVLAGQMLELLRGIVRGLNAGRYLLKQFQKNVFVHFWRKRS